ncbi:unnamed protein product [Caenorhabditis brenneri]
MPEILKVAQYFGFVFTEFSNVLLLFLITTKASTRFGTYKYLMISYALYSIVYGLVEICAQPIIHVYGAGMFLYVDSFLKYQKKLSNPMASAYCASFGLCVSLLATHFVYRYFAVCRNEILDLYDEDIRDVGYMAFLYYYYDPAGTLVVCWVDVIMCFIPCGVMQTCILTMIICGWKTFRKMREVKKSMSKKTKDLNNQLFKALVLQTLVPMCTMFAPVGSLLILPMFSIGVSPTLANAPSFYACLYPALDATIVIFMIRDFRDTVLCRKRVHPSLMSASTLSGKHASSHMSV